MPAGERGQMELVIYEPYGVTACIIPWNFPLQLLAWKMAPALAAGNSVVVVPSPLTPLATLRFAEVCTEQLPRGLVNVITGYGNEVGEAVVVHPQVRHVAFTGSVANGRRVAELAAKQVKKVTLELGGKDPLVVAPDADVDVAVHAIAFAGLLHAGQCCTSTERVYLPAGSYGEFREALVGLGASFRVGPGLDPASDMGADDLQGGCRASGRRRWRGGT